MPCCDCFQADRRREWTSGRKWIGSPRCCPSPHADFPCLTQACLHPLHPGVCATAPQPSSPTADGCCCTNWTATASGLCPAARSSLARARAMPWRASCKKSWARTGARASPWAPWPWWLRIFLPTGGAYHEIGLYLRANPLPGSPLAATDGPYDGVEGARRLVFAWFSAAELAGLDIRPAFLRAFLGDFLKQEPAGVLHIVHRDTPSQKTDGTAGAHQHTALTTG